MSYPIVEQIAEVRRELALRKALYPCWIASGKLKEHAARHQLAVCEAILETLERLDRAELTLEELEGEDFEPHP